jgi:hypothetical protein
MEPNYVSSGNFKGEKIMPRRKVDPVKISKRQMTASHRRMDLKGYPYCQGESCIRGMDMEEYLMQKGMTREEALGEIAALFAEHYLKEG